MASETLHMGETQDIVPSESVCDCCDKGDIISPLTPHEVLDMCNLYKTKKCRKFKGREKTMKLILKTKKDYVKYHIMLWNKVIEIIENYDFEQPFDASEVKEQAFKGLFGRQKIRDYCFGCGYSEKVGFDNLCTNCLFITKKRSGCLNGAWSNYYNSDTKEQALKAAKRIRDFKVKK